MEHDHQPNSPEQDVQLAQQALQQGELGHAFHHIGCALVSNPSNPEWLGVLNQAIASSPDPLALVAPQDDGTDFVTAAVRAYILAQQGNYTDALDLITSVVLTRPDVPFVSWIIWWLQQPTVLEGLELDFVQRVLVAGLLEMSTSCPSGMAKDDPRFPNVQGAAHVMHQLRQVHAEQTVVWVASSMVARRLGGYDDALSMAQTAHAMEPSWHSCIGIANTYRDMARLDDAVNMFRQSLTYDSEDVSSLLEIGDIYLGEERFNDAADAYDEVLAKEPEHPWAAPSRAFALFRVSGDPKHSRALLGLRAAGNHRAGELGDQIDPPRAYATHLPRGGDATCNALRATFEDMYQNPAEFHGSTYELELSHLESPSVLAAFALQMRMWGPHVTIKLEVKNIQQPDPRVPKAQVEFQLWAYDGVMPRPNVGEPSRDTVNALSELAKTNFSLEAWEPHARQIAETLGPGALDDLLGCMANPPPPPGSDWRVLVWVQRVQIAAALVIASIDEGWQGSLRQRALYAIAYGPVDWTVDAAVIALGSIARQNPAARDDVLQVFAFLRSQIPSEGFTCYEYPLAATWINVGGHDGQTQAMLDEWVETILSGKTGSSQVINSHIEPAG